MDYTNLSSLISSPWSQTSESILLEPFTYLLSNKGKEIRSLLIDAFNIWLDVPKEDLEVVRKVVEMLHTGSLLMDDVEDSSLLRRGSPVAHLIFGVPQTINTANYVYFLAYQELFKLRPTVFQSNSPAGALVAKDTELDRLVTEEMLSLHRGQGLELFWRDSLVCPTEEEYVRMVLGKTGGLFRMGIKLMMAKSASNIDFVPLVNLISILFQIRDDYMNLQSSQYSKNKGFAEDLTEGKFSFPVVHSIHANPTSRLVINTLQKKTSSPALLSHCVSYLRDETHSFTYTRGVLKTLGEEVRKEVTRLEELMREAGGDRDSRENVLLEKVLKALGEVPEDAGDEGLGKGE
ncbi:GGDP synthase [Mrakia frigida]|uniref:farnesyltranstransferase n=1 Tax=Mrakia frigida TaxID=29902 RepID=UPI003FCC256D